MSELSIVTTAAPKIKAAYLKLWQGDILGIPLELRDELARSAHHVHALPGVLDLLSLLRQREHSHRDIVLGLLTGNYTRAVPLKLSAVGVQVDWFSITAFGDEGASRPDLVALAMRKYANHTGHPADPNRVIVIGDTPRDIDAAKRIGAPCLAVATGHASLSELQAHGANDAASSLEEVSVERLFALAR